MKTKCTDCKYKHLCKYVEDMISLEVALEKFTPTITMPFLFTLDCSLYQKQVSNPRAVSQKQVSDPRVASSGL